MKEFINRKNEFIKVFECTKNSQFILINGKHKIGTTAFLKELHNRYNSKNIISLFIPVGSNQKQLIEYICKEIAKSDNNKIPANFKELAHYILKGEIRTNSFDKIIIDMPIIGNSLNRLWEVHKNKDIYNLNKDINPFLSYIKIFFQYFQDKNLEFIIIIDDLCIELEYDLKELLEVVEYKNKIKIISSVYLDINEYISIKFKDIADELSVNPQVVELKDISLEMIGKLAEARNVNLSLDQIINIHDSAKTNIYTVYQKLNEHSVIVDNYDNKRLINLLHVLDFYVSKKTLFELYNYNQDIVISYSNFCDILERLHDNMQIDFYQELVCYTSNSYIENYKETFPLSVDVIDFFLKNDKHLGKHELSKIKCLGSKVYPHSLYVIEKFYYRYLNLCIRTNDTNFTVRDIQIAFANVSDKSIIKKAIIAFFMINQFDEAYKYYKPLRKKYINDLELEILWGIILNRIRKHDKSEMVFKNLLIQNLDIDSECLIKCFLIINYIYQNNIKEAELLYNNNLNHLKTSKYYYYFRRNAISVISHDSKEAIDLLSDLLKVNYSDGFLQASLENNLGRSFLGIRKFDDAKFHLDKAIEIIRDKDYLNHTAIIYNNLAIYYYEIGKPNEAIKNINIAKGQSLEFMQKVFIHINKCVFLFEIDQKNSLKEIRKMEKIIIKKNIPHLRQVYLCARCYLEALNHNRTNLSKYVSILEDNLDVLRPKRTLDNIEIYKKIISDDLKITSKLKNQLYVPIYLVYWYVNPLSLLREESLVD